MPGFEQGWPSIKKSLKRNSKQIGYMCIKDVKFNHYFHQAFCNFSHIFSFFYCRRKCFKVVVWFTFVFLFLVSWYNLSAQRLNTKKEQLFRWWSKLTRIAFYFCHHRLTKLNVHLVTTSFTSKNFLQFEFLNGIGKQSLFFFKILFYWWIGNTSKK